MHVKLVKSYVESVMRYGLPIAFSAFMLAPKRGQETKVCYFTVCIILVFCPRQNKRLKYLILLQFMLS